MLIYGLYTVAKKTWFMHMRMDDSLAGFCLTAINPRVLYASCYPILHIVSPSHSQATFPTPERTSFAPKFYDNTTFHMDGAWSYIICSEDGMLVLTYIGILTRT